MAEDLSYFAYGSNLHPARLQSRIGPCPIIAVARLEGAELCFHKIGLDRSGKCNIVFRKNSGVEVWGVVYQISQEQKSALDQHESLGQGYQILNTGVLTRQRQVLPVFTYQAMPAYIDPRMQPFDWYHELVMQGSLFYEFPPSYLEQLKRIENLPDPDKKRAGNHEDLLRTIRESHFPDFEE